MPFMHLEDDITLDELARELAAIYRPQSLQYLAAALRTIAKQQLSGLSPEQYWLERQGIWPAHGWKRHACGRFALRRCLAGGRQPISDQPINVLREVTQGKSPSPPFRSSAHEQHLLVGGQGPEIVIDDRFECVDGLAHSLHQRQQTFGAVLHVTDQLLLCPP